MTNAAQSLSSIQTAIEHIQKFDRLFPKAGSNNLHWKIGRLCCWANGINDASPSALTSLLDLANSTVFPNCNCTADSPFAKSQRFILFSPSTHQRFRDSLHSERKRILLASSQPGQDWRQLRDWASYIRTWLEREVAGNPLIVTASGLSLCKLSVQASYWHNLDCCHLSIGKQKDLLTWLIQSLPTSDESNVYLGDEIGRRASIDLLPMFVSPALSPSNSSLPIQDRLAFFISNEIRLLQVRKPGTTWQLAKQYLTPSTNRTKSLNRLYIRISETSQPKSIKNATELMTLGAVGWHLMGSPPNTETVKPDDQIPLGRQPTIQPARDQENNSPAVLPWTPNRMSEFLSHHTRATPRLWPGETEAEFWRHWLLETDRLHGPLLTLVRILSQKRLRAGGHLIPGKTPMVCLSRRSPIESIAKKIYRSHLRRWDYLPYGLSLCFKKLKTLGVQPVHYFDNHADASDSELAKFKGPLAHPRYSYPRQQTAASNDPVDWSQEQEYRFQGDIDLRLFSIDEAQVFVRTRTEAQSVAPFSVWPVYYIDSQ